MAEPLPAPFLKFEDGDGREIPLISGNVWKIGRTEENAIVLPDDMVSRNHAMIQQLEGGEFYLIDMGSRNGSFVNGRRLTAPVALRDGDRLSFGEARLCFRNPAQVAAASRFARRHIGARANHCIIQAGQCFRPGGGYPRIHGIGAED